MIDTFNVECFIQNSAFKVRVARLTDISKHHHARFGLPAIEDGYVVISNALSSDEAEIAAVARRTSTTNWSDFWVSADKFPEVSAPGVKEKYTLPPIPDLNASQLKMVGWTDQEIHQM